MSYLFENRPRVYDDIVDAVEYLFSINPQLASDFLNRIEEAKESILNTPKGFVVKYSKVRTVLLKQFNYHIYYIIEEDKIVLLAILHAKSGEEKINKI